MRTLPAHEIKSRGIGAVDDYLKESPVYVIQNDEPSYVVMSLSHYQELLEAEKEASRLRLKASLEDVENGRLEKGSAKDLLASLMLEE